VPWPGSVVSWGHTHCKNPSSLPSLHPLLLPQPLPCSVWHQTHALSTGCGVVVHVQAALLPAATMTCGCWTWRPPAGPSQTSVVRCPRPAPGTAVPWWGGCGTSWGEATTSRVGGAGGPGGGGRTASSAATAVLCLSPAVPTACCLVESCGGLSNV